MKLGLLGMGRAGTRHALNALALGHEVCGYDEKFHTVKGDRIINWTAKVKPMPSRAVVLDESEAVIIATPSECHLDDLTACLAAGKHVLVEKPIGLIRQRKAVQDLIEINAKATNPVTVAVGYNLRFHPLVQKVREATDLEIVGGQPPYYASFTCCQYTESQDALTAGCLETWACHEIDLAEYLLGPLRLIDHHVERFGVNLGLLRWKVLPCHVHIHSDMRAKQRIRQILICTEDLSQRIDLEADPVTNEHYRWELEAFINRIHGDDDDTLASGADGVAALHIAERALI